MITPNMKKPASWSDKNWSHVVDLPTGEVWYSSLYEKVKNASGSNAFYWLRVFWPSDHPELVEFINDIPAELRAYFRTGNAKYVFGHTRFTAREPFGNFDIVGEKTLMAVLSVRFPTDDFGRRTPLIHSVRYV